MHSVASSSDSSGVSPHPAAPPPLDPDSASEGSSPSSQVCPTLAASDLDVSPLSLATSAATTATAAANHFACPPPPPMTLRALPLRPTNSLHSLLSPCKPAGVLRLPGRLPTASEAASEMISRGSVAQRDGEAEVEELLRESTRVFAPSVSGAETILTSPVDVVMSPSGRANSTQAESVGSTLPSPVTPMVARRVKRPSVQLEASTRTALSGGSDTVESYDRQLRRIVSREFASMSSLPSPATTTTAAATPPRQRLVSTSLYPVTPLESRGHARCSSRLLSPLGGTPEGAALSGRTAFDTEEEEEPASLMHFPVFHRLPESLRSRGSRSKRDEQSRRSTHQGPDAPSSSHRRVSHTAGHRGASSALTDAPARLSVVLPALSPSTSLTATAAVFSAEELVLPASSSSRSPADTQVSSQRWPHSMMLDPLATASSGHEILTQPNTTTATIPTAGVNSSSRTMSIPSAQLQPGPPRHLYRLAHDGRDFVDILGGPEPGRPGASNTFASVNASASARACEGAGGAQPQADGTRRGASTPLPPLSAQTSLTNVPEMSSVFFYRAASAEGAREAGTLRDGSAVSAASAAAASVGGVRQPTPLLRRLFREPKGHKGRGWVATGAHSLSVTPVPSEAPEQVRGNPDSVL